MNKKMDENPIEYLKKRGRQGVDKWNSFVKKGNEIPSLFKINLNGKSLDRINLSGADLRKSQLNQTSLKGAKFCGANLEGASFKGANLNDVDFTNCNLRNVNLRETSLVRTNFSNADITGAKIYGISAWELILSEAIQSDLIITKRGEPTISVDNLEIAQFIYLILRNEKLRDVLNTITSKAVLILGRFTPERKLVLDSIKNKLRKLDYLPIMFDFDIPDSRDITETITLLARLSKFIIADLSEPASIPKELESIIPNLAIPVLPIIKSSEKPYSMFKDYWKYDWVLNIHKYDSEEDLLESLSNNLLAACEDKLNELNQRRFKAFNSN
jgi:pentapeptide repeat protein